MFNRDASILALRTPCCTADMAFQLIDTETKDVLVSQWYIDGYSLAFSPDGLQFAYGLPLPNAPDGHHWSNYTATVVLIESRSGIIINTLKGRGRQSRPNGLTYSSNGELLAVDYSGYDSPDIFIWNINSRSITAILPQSPDNELGLTTPMGFSPDGAVLAVATRDGLQLWKIDLQ
jgi:WD40 repeat protein